MTRAISREQALQSYLIGEQIRAKQNGQEWDAEHATERFKALLVAERFDALGVDQATVDLGASVLMNATRTKWENATREQKAPWQRAFHAALVAIRDHKKDAISVRAHGTRAKYIKDGCHCPDCTGANTQYLQDLKARKKAGERPLIPADRSRAILQALIRRGRSLESLAQSLGHAHSSITNIANGSAKSVHPEMEEEIIRLHQQLPHRTPTKARLRGA